MEELHLGAVEAHFADIIWENEPLSSGELVTLCRDRLEWKKSTTYTVLRKLCDRWLFRNECGQVTSRLTREEIYAAQSRRFVKETFDGSLPAFLAAFTGGKPLTATEIAEIKAIIDTHREG